MNTELQHLYARITSAFEDKYVNSYQISVILDKISPELINKASNARTIIKFFKALIDLKTGYFYKSFEVLQDLVENNPDIKQYQYAIAILYCYLGRLEDAIFAFKCSHAGEYLPELNDWMPNINGSFQDHFEKIDEDPLLHQSRTIYKNFNQSKAISLMREACLCNKDNLDYWAELAYQFYFQKNWYECYQALKPIIINDGLTEITYRYLFVSLIKLGMFSNASQLYSKDLANSTNDFLMKFALIHNRQKSRLNDISFKKKSPLISTIKKLSAKNDKLKIAVIAGIISKDTANNAFLKLLGSFSDTINIEVSLFHETNYIAPWVQSTFDLFSRNLNISHINSETLQEILNRDKFSLLIDASEVEGDKRILESNNIPSILFGAHPMFAEIYGYDASLVDKFMIDGIDVSDFKNKSKVIICQEPLYQYQKSYISEKQLVKLCSSNNNNFILLSLPSYYDENIKINITKIVKALPNNWNLYIDSSFYGSESTCLFLINNLGLDKVIIDRILIIDNANLSASFETAHAVIDLYGHPSIQSLTSAISQAKPILCLDDPSNHQFLQYRTGAVVLKHNNLTETLFKNIDDLCLFITHFCSDSKYRFKVRNNVLKAINKHNNSVLQIDSLALSLFEFQNNISS